LICFRSHIAIPLAIASSSRILLPCLALAQVLEHDLFTQEHLDHDLIAQVLL
jgi:hypothetical protein